MLDLNFAPHSTGLAVRSRGASSEIRVLLISHTLQLRDHGQTRASHIARLPGIRLHTLAPHRWVDDHGAWRCAQTPEDDAAFTFEVGKVALPWGGPAKRYLHWYPQLGRILREFQPDVIDLWEEPWGVVSAHACWSRNRHAPSAKLIIETEQNINRPLPIPFERFRAYSLRNADYVIARNSEAIGVVRSRGYTGPAEVIGNAVDVSVFRPMPVESCRAKHNLSGFVVAYVGRLIEAKGVLDLVEALPACAPEARLLFVGNGPDRERIERRAAELGQSARIQYIPHCPPTELASLMNGIDLLALPSRTTETWKEQFGRVIIEAHACRKPVVGSDSGAIPHVVGDGGIIVPEQRPAELARAINELIADPDRRRQMGDWGYDQVHERYTWERIAQRMRDVYRSVSPVLT